MEAQKNCLKGSNGLVLATSASISSKQRGFITGRLAVSAIIQVLDDWYWALDKSI